MTCNDRTPAMMEPREFKELGAGQIAYVKPMKSEDLAALFPDAPEVEPGLRLWVLLNADGTPIMLSDSRDVAIANAEEHDLRTVALH
ncbi:MAG: NADH oxidase [Stappia sp.]|uniref:BQ00720 family protein n=1 Tax=Stappia sp. TaxID=1870903 RepID=UPI000C6A9FA1|nr:DUF1150 domain-containing protein [Stappia sp.]MAA99350.1 NADH oxidase [Stappia sp.]MBM19316.1 NADH oxidase [Stappia sp.]|tara:strand:+ start:1001 stop:1261 length:261 start_codon:yes stop_codon:yes gene_type:complete